jgi:hypothetical protein
MPSRRRAQQGSGTSPTDSASEDRRAGREGGHRDDWGVRGRKPDREGGRIGERERGREGGGKSLPGWDTTVGVFGSVVGVGTALAYIATANRTVTGGDNGELIAVANGLGVAHPPGYPLFTMLAAAMIRILSRSGMEVAFRVSVLSALCGGLCCWALLHALAVWFAADSEEEGPRKAWEQQRRKKEWDDEAKQRSCREVEDTDPSSTSPVNKTPETTTNFLAPATWRDILCSAVATVAFAANRRVWHLSTHGEVAPNKRSAPP